jgi:hypothetical protein
VYYTRYKELNDSFPKEKNILISFLLYLIPSMFLCLLFFFVVKLLYFFVYFFGLASFPSISSLFIFSFLMFIISLQSYPHSFLSWLWPILTIFLPGRPPFLRSLRPNYTPRNCTYLWIKNKLSRARLVVFGNRYYH